MRSLQYGEREIERVLFLFSFSFGDVSIKRERTACVLEKGERKSLGMLMMAARGCIRDQFHNTMEEISALY